MIVQFTADRAALESADELYTLCLMGNDEGGAERYLILQCPAAWGEPYELYLEINDEDEFGIDCVKFCVLELDRLRVIIDSANEDLGPVEEIEVLLQLPKADMRELHAGLERVFHGRPELLEID